MSNKIITPEEMAKAVIDSIRESEKAYGLKKGSLLNAMIEQYNKNIEEADKQEDLKE